MPGRSGVALALGDKLNLGEMGCLEHHRTGGMSWGQLENGCAGDQAGAHAQGEHRLRLRSSALARVGCRVVRASRLCPVNI